MIEAFLSGSADVLQPLILFIIFITTIFGIILGVLPGVSGGTAVVLLLPFLYGKDPLIFLPIMCTLFAVSNTGGSLTAILTGIPGDNSNAATVLDGFPMTRHGEGGRAVGAALMSGTTGALVSMLYAIVMMPVVEFLVMRFRSPEMMLMIVVGLAFLGVLSEKSKVKGVISACLGILLSTIGAQAITGSARFTFGNEYLYDGLNLVAMLMGLFGITMLAEISVSQETIAKANIGSYRAMLGEMWKGAKMVFKPYWWLWFRCTIIGYIIGIIPGIGGSAAIWAAYGHAKQTSKKPETFGKGNIEGVIAPETSNHGKDGGDLLTTFAFGIPGSGLMVFFLAAFLLLGLTPGPKMLQEHAPLCFSMLVSIVIATIFAAIIIVAALPYLIRITRIGPEYLFCFTVPLIFIGVFAASGVMFQLIVLLIIGALGLMFKEFGYSLPSIILGFVLGKLFEYYLWHSLDLHGFQSFMSPISIILIILIIVIVGQQGFETLYKHWIKPLVKRSK